MSVDALAGWTVGVTAARRREELGAALERRGARIVYGPAIRIVPLADDTELLEATKRCLGAPLDIVVATTGVGFRGWMDAAHTWGLSEPLTEALAGATILARGPKVRGAVRAADLREAWSPASESSNEVLEHLLSEYDLAGRRVAVQLHGEPLRDLVDAVRAAGAEVVEVPVYRWEPPADEQPLRRLIEQVATASVDALTFTSAPAAVNFLRTSDAADLGSAVRAALRGPVLCVGVGPVTSAPLVAEAIPVVSPDRFRLGALVREVVERLPERAVVLTAGGHRLEIRGRGVLVDDELRAVPATGMAMVRLLAERPGHVVSRDELGAALPGEGGDGHAVEVAVGRLRSVLGDSAIVSTVVKRGYRLDVARS